MRRLVALIASCMALCGRVAADSIHRLNTSSVDVIPTINTLRFTNITGGFGGEMNNTNLSPNWGAIVQNVAYVYPDAMGQIAWVLLFAIPFLMMWIGHADMVVPGIAGIFLGLFVYGFIGSDYAGVAGAFVMISIVSILWSLLQKRG